MKPTTVGVERVYRYLKNAETWVTSRQIADGVKVSHRTARHHALTLVRAGVVERKWWFPSSLYRLTTRAVW